MLFLKILAVLVLLLLLLCLLRLGVRASWGEETRVTAILGPVRLQVIPRKERPEKKKKEEKTAKKAKEKPPKERPPLPKPSREDIRDAIRLLLPAGKKALRKLGRGIRVEPLRLSLVLGGKNDPADAAEKFGYLQAAMWSGMPQLERLLRIPDPRIHTEVDFDAEKTSFSGEAAVTLRLGTLIAMGFALLVPVVRWFLGCRRRRKEAKENSAPPAGAESSAPETAA